MTWLHITVGEFKAKFSDILEYVKSGKEVAISYGIKSQLGKVNISDQDLEEMILISTADSFEFYDLDMSVVKSFDLISFKDHRDPFDRMIIWQAIHHNLTLISKDERFKEYKGATPLKLLW